MTDQQLKRQRQNRLYSRNIKKRGWKRATYLIPIELADEFADYVRKIVGEYRQIQKQAEVV